MEPPMHTDEEESSIRKAGRQEGRNGLEYFNPAKDIIPHPLLAFLPSLLIPSF
jgi:hypothetical protein